jgi:hypothetical protein
MNSDNVIQFPAPCPAPSGDCPQTAKLAAHQQSIGDLKEWQQKQNGSLQRLEDRMDAAIKDMQKAFADLNKRIDQLLIGIVAAAFSVATGLLVLILKK